MANQKTRAEAQFIQITSAGVASAGGGTYVHALDAYGNVWEYNHDHKCWLPLGTERRPE